MEAVLISSHADETQILHILLQRSGFMVRTAHDMNQAIEDWPENPAELILIALAGEHSKLLTQIKQLRAHTAVPILLISDLLTDDLHVNYFEAGADLIVIRPYSVRALLAQICAVIRRGSGVPFSSLPTLTQKDVHLDPTDRTVKVGEGDPKRLTQLEFRLLYTLMIHAGQIIPTDKIVENVWGYSGEGNRELVRGLVQRVRSKVEPTPSQPRYILTDPGIGYYFPR